MIYIDSVDNGFQTGYCISSPDVHNDTKCCAGWRKLSVPWAVAGLKSQNKGFFRPGV